MEIAIRNIFKVIVISIFSLHYQCFLCKSSTDCFILCTRFTTCVWNCLFILTTSSCSSDVVTPHPQTSITKLWLKTSNRICVLYTTHEHAQIVLITQTTRMWYHVCLHRWRTEGYRSKQSSMSKLGSWSLKDIHETPETRHHTTHSTKEDATEEQPHETFRCSHCGTYCSTKVNLKRHVNRNVQNKRIFPCGVCECILWELYHA